MRKLAEHAPLDTTGVQHALDTAIGDAVVGALIRVDDRDEGSWTATAGSARADEYVPVDPGGFFRIGSITKTFVATVVLQLVADGVIGLDDPLQRHLPGVLPTSYPEIAVRDLLLNTSGIPNYLPDVLSDLQQVLANRTRSWTPEQLVAIAAAQPLAFEPGTTLGYSNTNYVLLGMLIRAVTGNGWGTEVDRRIAKPLALAATFDPGDTPTLPTPHARGYLTLTNRGERELVDITDYSMSVADAAGSMISTARDLNTFFGALLSGQLLGPALLQRMLAPSDKGRLLGVFNWGLGIESMSLEGLPGGGPVYGIGGGFYGYAGFALATRDARRCVTVSLNTADNDPTGQTRTLIDIARAALAGDYARRSR